MNNQEPYTEEDIRAIAHLYWEARMGAEAPGTADGDWFYAENLIREIGYVAALKQLAG